MSDKSAAVRADDYIYISTRVRAADRGLIKYQRCLQMAEAKSPAELDRMLDESGFKADGDIEEALEKRLEEAFVLVTEAAPVPEIFDIFRYPYDCHNIKSALKNKFRTKNDFEDEDPYSILYSVGSIPRETVVNAIKTRKYSAFPKNMARAAEEANDAYAQSRDPRQIDILLDRACYADMSETAAEYKSSYLLSLLDCKKDTVNILTCIRMLRMDAPHFNYDYFRRAMAEPGKLGEKFFAPCFEGDGDERESKLYKLLLSTDYASLGKAFSAETPSLSYAERACENLYLERAASAKQIFAGPEVPAAYIVAREYEVKNLRILITAKRAGVPADRIKERLRLSYV